MKLVTAAEMRALEEAAATAGTPTPVLMENAGRAVAEAVREHLHGARARRVVVLVGPGNNGGDGLVAARHLYDFGEEVFVYLLGQRPDADPHLEALRSRGIDIAVAGEPEAEERFHEALDRADAVIDAVLGTGRARPLTGAIASAFEALRSRRVPLYAVDLPTGIDSDSGDADEHAATADVTFALGFSKVGLHAWPGSSYAGRVEVLDIGLPAGAGDELTTVLLEAVYARAHLPPRPGSSNKGTFGRLLVVAGSESYTGAAVLTALGALRAGAGLVTLAVIPQVRSAAAAHLAEATYLVLAEDAGRVAAEAANAIVAALPQYDALVIGPGLGQSMGVSAFVRGVLGDAAARSVPILIDADGLNALAGWRGWWEQIPAGAVLTPHPGELSRLARASVPEIQAARLDVARAQAAQWRQTLVLKGAHTIIADSGAAYVSPFATPALATAGTGDVLSGAIGGLLAQGVAPLEAAAVGVYLHGAAGESYRDEYGDAGLLASEVAAAIAREAARLRSNVS